MRQYGRALRRQRLIDAGLCTVCKAPQPEHRRGKQKCVACQRMYAKQNMALLSAGDLTSEQIERRINAAYARIQAERRAGLRPGVEQYAWARTYDPVQANGPDGPVETKHAAQAVSPKAPRSGRAA